MSVVIAGSRASGGEVVLERLLSGPSVERIYVLKPRPVSLGHTSGVPTIQQDDHSSELNAPVFQRLRQERGDSWLRSLVQSRVQWLEWDLALPDFGLSPAASEALKTTKSLFLCDGAASNCSQAELRKYLQVNILEMVHFVQWVQGHCPQLKSAVYVSSFASHMRGNSNKVLLGEQPLKLQFDAQETVDSLLSINNDIRLGQEVGRLMQISGCGNVHSLSKVLCESLLVTRCTIPSLTIVRSAIVGPAFQFPFPGYFKGLEEPLPSLALVVSMGYLRHLPGSPSHRMPLIPTDILASIMISTALQALPGINYINACSSKAAPLSWGRMATFMTDYFSCRHEQLQEASEATFSPIPSLDFGGSPTCQALSMLLSQPRAVSQGWMANKMEQPQAKRPQSDGNNNVDFIAAAEVVNHALTPFCAFNYKSPSANVQRLALETPDAWLEGLILDVRQVDWQLYIKQMCQQVVIRLGGEPSKVPPSYKMFEDGPAHDYSRASKAVKFLPRYFPDLYLAVSGSTDGVGKDIPAFPGLSAETKAMILSSPAVKNAIEETKNQFHLDEDQVIQEANTILNRMGDKLNSFAARPVVLVLRKAFRKVYNEIKLSGVHNLQTAYFGEPNRSIQLKGRKRTVVLVPTHRSYLDFVVVSYLLHTLDMPLPHIVAAEDFLNLGPVSDFMRQLGAFFMRRQFQGDVLYSALFKEYIRTLIYKGACLEFFIEGTRSRTGKMLTPKKGILKTVLKTLTEKGMASPDDIVFVPVSITFDKLVEAGLYSDELQGGGKPKETLDNLLKSAQILLKTFGTVHLNFGEPISVKTCMSDSAAYVPFPQCPSRTEMPVAERRKDEYLLSRLSWLLTYHNQKGLMTTPTTMFAMALVNCHHYSELLMGVPLKKVIPELELVRRWVLQRTDQVEDQWKQAPAATLAEFAIGLMSPQLTECQGIVRISDVRDVVYLTIYSNQCLHLFVDEAIIACATLCQHKKATEGAPIDWKSLQAQALFLRDLLNVEFPCNADDICPESADQWFTRTLRRMQSHRLGLGNAQLPLKDLQFLSDMLYPFIEAYWLVAAVSHTLNTSCTEAQFMERICMCGEALTTHEKLFYRQVTNLDTLRNTIQRFRNWNVLVKTGNPPNVCIQKSSQTTPLQLHSASELGATINNFRRFPQANLEKVQAQLERIAGDSIRSKL